MCVVTGGGLLVTVVIVRTGTACDGTGFDDVATEAMGSADADGIALAIALALAVGFVVAMGSLVGTADAIGAAEVMTGGVSVKVTAGRSLTIARGTRALRRPNA